MRNGKLLVLPLIAICLSGCYLPRSIDSYNSTFRPGPPEPNRADPYSFGGIADGSGGTMTRTSYSTDSKSPDPRSATETGRSAMFDQPRIEAQSTAPPANIDPTGPGAATLPPHPGPDIQPQKGSTLNPQPMRG